MLPVLFEIPTPWIKIPIYGFGLMLVIALFVSTWLACRRAQQEGIAKERIQDLALWMVICGILGARIVYMRQYDRPLTEFFQLWQGGLVFYGSLIGGAVGLVLAHIFVFRKYKLPWLKVADVIAPSLAVGLAIGRIGCLLNGCCYGDVACPHCVGLPFPASAPAFSQLVGRGLETAAGFTVATDKGDLAAEDRSRVVKVEPDSAAKKAGLEEGDYVIGVNGRTNQIILELIEKHRDETKLLELENKLAGTRGRLEEIKLDDKVVALRIFYPADETSAASADDSDLLQEDEKKVDKQEGPVGGYFDRRHYDILWQQLNEWPRDRQRLTLTVRRGDNAVQDIKLEPYRPTTLDLHPTQVYETISMTLLFLLLTAYYPFRRIDGQILGLFLTLYAVHRYLNELLRNDTDPVKFGMTLSQNISVLVLLAGLLLLNRDRVARALQPVRRALVGG
jgi:phosphatidylglycerol---prolipoprotein diacylglyceryl transferase